jgi:excinuclease UvrABC ATPase subunit
VPLKANVRAGSRTHDGGRIVFDGRPADLVAARSTLTGEHVAAYVGT